MKNFLLSIILLIINTRTFAQEQVSNLITPVSYLSIMSNNLKFLMNI
ncbi:MAG: hypothetical protein ACEY3E_03515 [Candidatus Tisiphia sp.]